MVTDEAGSGGDGVLLADVGMAVERSLARGIAEHRIEHLLDGQRVGAAAGRLEEMAVALPRFGVERHGVGAVVAGEAGAERLQLHTVRLMRVAHRLLDLADHARMHVAGTSMAPDPPGALLTWRSSGWIPWPWRAAP